MNRIGMLIVSASLVLSPAVLQGQDHAAAGPASQHTTHKPPGFADYALGKINPNDTDYGAALDAARGATVLYLTPNAQILYVLASEIRNVGKRIGFALSAAFQHDLLDTRVLTNPACCLRDLDSRIDRVACTHVVPDLQGPSVVHR